MNNIVVLSFITDWLLAKYKESINEQLITLVTYKRASGQCYLQGLCLALYSVLLFVAPLPRYGTVPFVPAALTLLVFLTSGRSKVWGGGGSKKGRFRRRFEPALAAASTFSVREIGLFFEGFWIDLCCSSSCRPWLMITCLITCCLTFLRQKYDLEAFFHTSARFDALRAARTASPVSGVRAPPVAMSGTVGVRPKPAQHNWKEWTSEMREIRNTTLSSAYLCFERDLFLCNLEREQERERRGRPERLEERLFVPTEMGRTALATERTKQALLRCSNASFDSIPGSMAAAMVDWASLTLFITLSSSLAAACGVISGGLTMALLEWLILKHTFRFTQSESIERGQVRSLPVQHGLQGPVSKHDSVEGQRPGDGVLLGKLHEGEARRLGLVSGHSDELHAPHLPEELEQLLCGGGLQTEGMGRAFNQLSVNTGGGGRCWPPQIRHPVTWEFRLPT